MIYIYIYDMHITPLPSVCIYAPFIHFHRMKEQGGSRWSSPATERGVKKVYTLLFLIE